MIRQYHTSGDIMVLATVYALTSSYEMHDGKTSVVIHGITSNGKHVRIIDQFDPFCYVEGLRDEHLEKLEDMLKHNYNSWKDAGHNPYDFFDVQKIEQVELKHRDGSSHKMHKLYLGTPRDVPKVRSWIFDYMTVYSGDILYPLRYYFTMDLGAFFRVSGDYDPETKTISNPVYKKADPFEPQLKLMGFDIENSMDPDKDGNVFVIGIREVDPINDTDRTYHIRSTGAELYLNLLKEVKDFDPDMFITYNGDGYDWPHIMEQMEKYGIEPKFGRDDSNIRKYEKTNKNGNTVVTIKIVGRISFDVYKMVHRTMQLPKEGLDDVARELEIGSKTEGVDASRIDEFWNDNSQLVCEYCENDASLAIDIALHDQTKFITTAISLGIPAKLPLEETINPVSSRLIDSVLIRRFEERGYATPMHNHAVFDSEYDEDNDYEGGFVKQPIAGMHRWVTVLDFKSMYPSQEIENNICWTTYICEEKGVAKIRAVGEELAVHFERVLERDEDKNPIKSEWITHFFMSPEKRKGVIPQVMIEFMEWRASAKDHAEAYKDNPALFKYYDSLQYSIKVLMNSFYGILGAAFYRYSFKEIAESITGASRETLKKTVKIIEEAGHLVLYTDTDSVFILTGAKNIEDAKLIGMKLAKDITKGYLILEYENTFSIWFNHGKKKYYIGRDGETNKYKVRGYALRRRDAFPLQREVLKDVLYSIVNDKDMDKIFGNVKSVITELLNGKTPPKDLVITKSVRDESKYKHPDSMMPVKIARKMRAAGRQVLDGQRVSYIVTQGKTPMDGEPVYSGHEIPDPDLKYYAERLLTMLGGSSKKKPNILAAFGWDKHALKSGLKQRSLDGYF